MSFLGQAGKLRALAVTTPTRWSELADVPTVAEAGVPGYEATLWLGLAAPAGTPAEIVNRLYAETAKAAGPGDAAELPHRRRHATAMNPQEFGTFMRAEYEKWGRVVRETGATVN